MTRERLEAIRKNPTAGAQLDIVTELLAHIREQEDMISTLEGARDGANRVVALIRGQASPILELPLES